MTPSLSGRIAEIVPGRAAEHALGLDADRVHLAGALVDRDDRRLGQHDAAPAHVHEGVGRAEVDRHVAAAEPADVVKEADGGASTPHVRARRGREDGISREIYRGAVTRTSSATGSPTTFA